MSSPKSFSCPPSVSVGYTVMDESFFESPLCPTPTSVVLFQTVLRVRVGRSVLSTQHPCPIHPLLVQGLPPPSHLPSVLTSPTGLLRVSVTSIPTFGSSNLKEARGRGPTDKLGGRSREWRYNHFPPTSSTRTEHKVVSGIARLGYEKGNNLFTNNL